MRPAPLTPLTVVPALSQGPGSAPGAGSLSAMTVDAVCERLKQIEGLEPSMLPQYCATVRKVRPPGWGRGTCARGPAWPLGLPAAGEPVSPSLHPGPQANINGRVLAQCNIDELKKEMNMNFGDWHLFRSTVSHSELTARPPRAGGRACTHWTSTDGSGLLISSRRSWLCF